VGPWKTPARFGSAQRSFAFRIHAAEVMGPRQRVAVTEAFGAAASGQWSGDPADWFQETTPETCNFKQNAEWRQRNIKRGVGWSGEESGVAI